MLFPFSSVTSLYPENLQRCSQYEQVVKSDVGKPANHQHAGFPAKNNSIIETRKSLLKHTIKIYCRRLAPRSASRPPPQPEQAALTAPPPPSSSHSDIRASCDLCRSQTPKRAHCQIRRSSKNRQADLLTALILALFRQDPSPPSRTPTFEAPLLIRVQDRQPSTRKMAHHLLSNDFHLPSISRGSKKPGGQGAVDPSLPRLMSHPTLRPIRSSGKITNGQSFRRRTLTRPTV